MPALLPSTPDHAALRNFLAISSSDSDVDLCLPVFDGPAGTPLLGQYENDPYVYRSETMASRDVRSALYIQGLLASEIDSGRIHVREPRNFLDRYRRRDGGRIGFLFGSKSNRALKNVALDVKLDRFVRFSFGKYWTITGQDERKFRMQNPVDLPPEVYGTHTDYAVIARAKDAKERSIFFIAGLGGRATEGAGHYLLTHWPELHSRAGQSDFAAVLEFQPPVKPESAELAAFYSETGAQLV